jgi:hypothetical protein
MTRNSHRTSTRHRAERVPAGQIPTSLKRSAATSAASIACVGLLSWAMVTAVPTQGALAAQFGPGTPAVGGPSSAESRPNLGSADPSGLDTSWVGPGTPAVKTPTPPSRINDARDPSGLDGWPGADAPVKKSPKPPSRINDARDPSGLDGWPGADAPVKRNAPVVRPNLGSPDPAGLDTGFVGQGVAGGATIPKGGVKGEVIINGNGGRVYVGTDGVSTSLVTGVGTGVISGLSTAAEMPVQGATFEAAAEGAVGPLKIGVSSTLDPATLQPTKISVTGGAALFRGTLEFDPNNLANGPTEGSAAFSPSLGLSAGWMYSRVDTVSVTWENLFGSPAETITPQAPISGYVDGSQGLLPTIPTTPTESVPTTGATTVPNLRPEASVLPVAGYVDGSQGLTPTVTITPTESTPATGATTVPDLGQGAAATPAASEALQASTTMSDPTITASSPAASTVEVSENQTANSSAGFSSGACTSSESASVSVSSTESASAPSTSTESASVSSSSADSGSISSAGSSASAGSSSGSTSSSYSGSSSYSSSTSYSYSSSSSSSSSDSSSSSSSD